MTTARPGTTLHGMTQPASRSMTLAHPAPDDQRLSDADQTLSDTDRTLSESDQAAAVGDQLAADRDQAAADRDLLENAPLSPGEATAYVKAQQERHTRSVARTRNRVMRQRTATERDALAAERIRVALLRDEVADD